MTQWTRAEKEYLSDLIGRLTKAMGPDRGIDARIMALVNPSAFDDTAAINHWDEQQWRMAAGIYVAPLYTASIDAALTLVNGRAWEVGTSNSGLSFATIYDADDTCPPDRYQQQGATPAIALCIAALKAREAAR